MQLVKTLGFAAFAAIATAAFTPTIASADVVNLTATGGILNDDNGTTNGISFYLFGPDVASQTITSVNSVTLTGLTHTYVSDLYVSLIFQPFDTNLDLVEAVLFDGLNDGDDFVSNNLNGNYTFSNSALFTLQDLVGANNTSAIIPGGTYLPSEFYFQGFESAPVVDLSSTFAGIDLSTGRFLLYFEDFEAGDFGTLTSASLSVNTVVPEPTSIAAIGMLAGAALRRRR